MDPMSLLPAALRWRLQDWLDRRRHVAVDRLYAGKSAQEIFSHIYRSGLWGKAPEGGFCSGVGSHAPAVVGAYVSAVSDWLRSLPQPPAVVDLGCGDFNIGRQVRSLCGTYVACDVVPDLIESHRRSFAETGVDFRVLDMIAEPLPAGEVVFIRQVLQHLSNDQIAAVLPKLSQYRYLVLTEHLPATSGFIPNLDKPAGHGIRVGRTPPSAVVLDAPPFNLLVGGQQVLVEVPSEGGVVQTVLFTLPDPKSGSCQHQIRR
jgi:hypothetical protein